MIAHLRLAMIDPLVLLFLIPLAFCKDNGNLSEGLPISLPPSQLWYVT